jgi:hypothetical protein
MLRVDQKLRVFACSPGIAGDLRQNRVGHPGIVAVILDDERRADLRRWVPRTQVDDDDVTALHV